IGQRLLDVLRREHGFEPRALRVEVEESFGQAATYHWERGGDARCARWQSSSSASSPPSLMGSYTTRSPPGCAWNTLLSDTRPSSTPMTQLSWGSAGVSSQHGGSGYSWARLSQSRPARAGDRNGMSDRCCDRSGAF